MLLVVIGVIIYGTISFVEELENKGIENLTLIVVMTVLYVGGFCSSIILFVSIF
jgi:hypothetical protein